MVKTIDLSDDRYTGIFPITVNDDNSIGLDDIYYDEHRNLVIGSNNSNNRTDNLSSLQFVHIEGQGNEAKAKRVQVQVQEIRQWLM